MGVLLEALRLPKSPGIVVDGFRLLPHLVKPLLAVTAHAIWLLPTASFRKAVFGSRDWARAGFTAKSSNPERAFQNLLERDAMFTLHLQKEVKRLGLSGIDINSMLTEDDSVKLLVDSFGLYSSSC